MKNFYNKNFKLLIVAVVLMTGSLSASAGTGWCTNTSGTPYTFNFNFNYNLIDPTQNYAGKTFPDAYIWSSGSQYPAHCDTDLPKTGTYFTADSPGTFGHTDGSLTYYSVNEYLEVAATITMVTSSGGSSVERAVPFSNHFNNVPFTPAQTTTFASGGKGHLSLYFTKPFVGQMVIPPTVVARLYASQAQGSYSSTPVSQVMVNGTVTVPQSCNINAGQVVNVDFGNILATNIRTPGAIAAGFTPKVVNFTLACSNISDGVNVSLSINGVASSGDPSTLGTTNPDIGVRFMNSLGTTVPLHTGRLPVTMNYFAQTGTSTMSLAPINLTGNTPVAGGFTAIATINAEMQ